MDLSYDNGYFAKNKLRFHGLTPSPASSPAVPERKLRCRLPDRAGNRCPNEEISDFGLCAHHLAGAAAEFRSLTSPALRGGDGR